MEVAAVTFNISNPTLRKGTLLKFTSYDVSSTVTHSDSMSENFVQRRYSDFLWLHEALRERNSGCIIPPLPKKQFLGRFHPLFIENRIRGMEKFLSKVLAHPVLRQELYLHTFLEVSDITQAQKIFESCKNSANSGVINWLQTQKNVLTASESSMVKSQVMVETESRIQPILDHMANAVKYAPKTEECTVALEKQQTSLMALRRKHGEACLAVYEVDVSHDAVAIPALQQFASSELALVEIIESHITSVEIEVIEPLQRYKSTVFALRASVTSQRNKRANHIAANSAIQRDSVRNPNHDELVAKATRCLNEYVDASNRLDADYARYHKERNDDLLLLLNSMVNLQVQNCQNSQLLWSELEKSLLESGSSAGVVEGVASNSGQWTSSVRNQHQQHHQQSSIRQSSSLLDLQEEEEDLEGRESDYFASV